MPKPTCNDVAVLSVNPHGPEGLSHGLWLLELENPGWTGMRPGQFAMLRPVAWGFEPVWARPFSVCRATPDRLAFLIQAVGRGTRLLTGLKPGDQVTIWGPLGHAFNTEPGVRTLMLAGGVGLAPFVEYCAAHPTPSNLTLLFGHRPPLSCYPYEDIARLANASAFRETSPQDIPRFVALIEEAMADHAGGLALACGPTPFLRSVRAAALRLGVRCQLSLENRMACGIGACLGCVATDAEGHNIQTCTRGPVFWANEITL